MYMKFRTSQDADSTAAYFRLCAHPLWYPIMGERYKDDNRINLDTGMLRINHKTDENVYNLINNSKEILDRPDPAPECVSELGIYRFNLPYWYNPMHDADIDWSKLEIYKDTICKQETMAAKIMWQHPAMHNSVKLGITQFGISEYEAVRRLFDKLMEFQRSGVIRMPERNDIPLLQESER